MSTTKYKSLAAASSLGLAFLVDQSRRVRQDAEDSLVEALGADFEEGIESRPTPAALAGPWRRLVYPFRMREPRVHVERDIVYHESAGRRGMLDVYRPADVPLEGAPVLLQVHGGGWSIGRKDQHVAVDVAADTLLAALEEDVTAAPQGRPELKAVVVGSCRSDVANLEEGTR